MAVHYNGIEVKRVFYNGTPLTSLFFNDVNVLGNNPVTQVVTYDGNVDTTNRYGRTPSESPYARNGWRDVVTRSMTAAPATGSTFYYRFDAHVYWQANNNSCTSLQFRIEDADGNVVTFAAKTPTAYRGEKHVVFDAESPIWLGNTSSLKVSMYYTTQDSAGNYMYAAYYGTSYPVTIKMSNNPIE